MNDRSHTVDLVGWERFSTAHQVGDVIEVDVVRVAPFGCFVRADEGVDGLAPGDSWPTRIRVRIAAVDDRAARFSVTPA